MRAPGSNQVLSQMKLERTWVWYFQGYKCGKSGMGLMADISCSDPGVLCCAWAVK